MAGRPIALWNAWRALGRIPPGGKHAPRLARALIVATLVLVIAPSAASAEGEAIKAEVSVTTSGGYGRIVLRFAEEVETDVRASNNIVIIGFKKPVDISVDRINVGGAGYISAARKDPDGKAIRLALSRKVTINSMMAGERVFIDLLPDGWKGLPPGLPQEVVDELARRAREAEKHAREREQLLRQNQEAPITVRIGRQPTFTRFVFELRSLIAVAVDRSAEKLTLLFDAPLKFDFGEAKAALPSGIASIETEAGQDTTQVHFHLSEQVDVRTFREDKSYVVDITPIERKEASEASPSLPQGELKELKTEPSAASAQPADPSSAAQQPLTITVDVPIPQPRPPNAPPRERSTPARAAGGNQQALAPASEPTPAERTSGGEVGGSRQESPPPQAEAVIPSPAQPPQGGASEAPAAGSSQSAERQSDGSTPDPARKKREPLRQPAHEAQSPSPLQASAGEEPVLKARELNAPIVPDVRREGESLRITFPFAVQTSAAVFRRFDSLWFVADSKAPIDVRGIVQAAGPSIRGVESSAAGDSQIIRLRLDRPKLASLKIEGASWTITLGDPAPSPTRPVSIVRNILGGGRANVSIAYDNPQRVVRLSDPDVGDTLMVVTSFGPPRGLLRAQDFVEFRALASIHGVVIQPLADELSTEIGPDRIVIGRPGGLTLSLAAQAAQAPQSGQLARTAGFRPLLIDNQLWGFDREAEFLPRRDQLIRAAAEAPDQKRTEARLELARFLLARDMYYEAKAVLDLAVDEDRVASEDPSAIVLRAIATILIGRTDEALKDLASPVVGNQQAAPLWRAIALMRQGKWAEAREGFRASEGAIVTLPVELQRMAIVEAARAAIEMRDFEDAKRLLNEFDVIGLPREMQARVSVLRGRVDEGLGRLSEALSAYRTAAASWDRPHAAQGRLREVILRYSLAEISRPDAVAALEELTTVWRGDETEIEALQLLAHLYTEEGRFRDAFRVMRAAMLAHPGSEMTRRIQEEAAATFDSLFLAGKGDAMPAIEAVSLFYDFRELTPIGRRGDEMIRRLADRLVSVDLLDQAAELLQYQIDHRLQGVARAHVGVKLAVINLMNRNPERALQALRSTRSGDMPTELRNQRLILEARALSDSGRHNLALEVAAGMNGREIDRLRADIYWAAKRWREAAEQIERLYGERWRDFAPLSEPERADILRAGIAYALAEDALGLDRFRERYLPKMADTPDRSAFEIVTRPYAAASADFKEVTAAALANNPLEGLLREMRARYPDFGAAAPAPRPGSAQSDNRQQRPSATDRRTAGG